MNRTDPTGTEDVSEFLNNAHQYLIDGTRDPNIRAMYQLGGVDPDALREEGVLSIGKVKTPGRSGTISPLPGEGDIDVHTENKKPPNDGLDSHHVGITARQLEKMGKISDDGITVKVRPSLHRDRGRFNRVDSDTPLSRSVPRQLRELSRLENDLGRGNTGKVIKMIKMSPSELKSVVTSILRRRP